MELFQKKMNKFSPLNHTRDGFWELDENELWTIPLEVPLILRMTSANGEVLEDVIDAISKYTLQRRKSFNLLLEYFLMH